MLPCEPDLSKNNNQCCVHVQVDDLPACMAPKVVEALPNMVQPYADFCRLYGSLDRDALLAFRVGNKDMLDKVWVYVLASSFPWGVHGRGH